MKCCSEVLDLKIYHSFFSMVCFYFCEIDGIKDQIEIEISVRKGDRLRFIILVITMVRLVELTFCRIEEIVNRIAYLSDNNCTSYMKCALVCPKKSCSKIYRQQENEVFPNNENSVIIFRV